jgi:hypothetical protein
MPLLTSPLMWVLLGVFYFIFKKKDDPSTDLGIFTDTVSTDIDPKTGQPKPTKTVTSSGTVITGATINVAKAKAIALTLMEQFDAFFSSEADIMKTLNGLNYADFILVYDQFGNSHTRSLFGNEALSSNGDDLIYWITKEVTSDSNKAKLHKQFPTVF